ncbi:MAG: hypothetical protein GEV03_21420 [Streptosporangiales bacterium]|nr:hypothetical protein [Streptosporangiales bacterium]
MPEVLEAGDIYFLYRPRVEHEEVAGPGDVQRLYVVLKTWDGGWHTGSITLSAPSGFLRPTSGTRVSSAIPGPQAGQAAARQAQRM